MFGDFIKDIILAVYSLKRKNISVLWSWEAQKMELI
jgi:hypothetical protein